MDPNFLSYIVVMINRVKAVGRLWSTIIIKKKKLAVRQLLKVKPKHLNGPLVTGNSIEHKSRLLKTMKRFFHFN